MTRQPTAKLWAHVPGVVYPGEKRWGDIPGVSYPDRNEVKHATILRREQRARREARITAEILALYDGGKTARQSAEAVGISTDTALKILRKNNRPIFKGVVPKAGRGGIHVRERRRQSGEAYRAKLKERRDRALAIYEAMPHDSRTALGLAKKAGINPKTAYSILTEAGYKIGRPGRRKTA